MVFYMLINSFLCQIWRSVPDGSLCTVHVVLCIVYCTLCAVHSVLSVVLAVVHLSL